MAYLANGNVLMLMEMHFLINEKINNFKFALSASPKLLNLNQGHSSKKCFFRSNAYKIEVVIISHRNSRVTKLWS